MSKGNEKLEHHLNEALNDVIALRRTLHQHPEPGFQEHDTASRIVEFISNVPGLDIRKHVAETGVIVTLGAEKTGPCVAFRADMDCLPIQEETGLSYASETPGLMHACGHDGHSAILAGLVRVLGHMQDSLAGPVKFIFQPAEEGLGGASVMVKEGGLQNPQVDMIFALHGWPEIELGKVAACAGASFASTDAFSIRVKGKGGHAAFPHNTVDPVIISAGIINAVQSIVSRTVDPLESAVVSICEVHGGNAVNVIADEVVLRGTIRCFDTTLREQLKKRLQKVAMSVAQAHGGEATVEIRSGYPSLHCSEKAVDLFFKSAKSWMSEGQVQIAKPTMGGEDFAYFANEVPGCLWLLGVGEGGNPPLLHTSKYNFNDKAIYTAIRMQAELALKFQENH